MLSASLRVLQGLSFLDNFWKKQRERFRSFNFEVLLRFLAFWLALVHCKGMTAFSLLFPVLSFVCPLFSLSFVFPFLFSGHPGVSLSPLGVTLGPLGALGQLLGPLGVPLGPLGVLLGPPGLPWGPVGAAQAASSPGHQGKQK